jgi:hypothetical protein
LWLPNRPRLLFIRPADWCKSSETVENAHQSTHN